MPGFPPGGGYGGVAAQPGFCMNPFATIPIDHDISNSIERYPALNLIGNTRMVEILCFKEEFPEVSIYAKAEYANPAAA